MADTGSGDPLDEVVQHYESVHEEDRLAQGLGSLELVRTQEILRRHLPPPPARVLDVGGGTGIHAEWLSAERYEVEVVDLTPRHVEHVQATLADRGVTATVGDARQLQAADGSVDVALLLGPLYHLPERAHRMRALEEARRVVRPGGLVAVAAISRFASLFDGLARGFLFDAEFRAIVERDLVDGRHRNDQDRPGWFTTAFFHHPDELRAELVDAGLLVVDLVGVEGMAGWQAGLEARWDDPAEREVILDSCRLVESEPSLLGLSAHLLAACRAPG